MNIPSVLLDFLRANNIPYEIIPHAKVFTARMAAAAEGIERHHQTKVVMLSTPEGPVMAVGPSDLKSDVQQGLGLNSEPASFETVYGLFPLFAYTYTATISPLGEPV